MIDIIITSYDRPQKVLELARNIFDNTGHSSIIIDSGGNEFSTMPFIHVIRSSYKNQPYQRYLGYLASNKKWVLFLDDDMEPIKGWYEKVVDLIQNNSDKGMIGLNFEDKHHESFLKKTPKSVLSVFNRFYFSLLFRRWSGYPVLEPGVYYKNGVKGSLPNESGWVEHTSGGAFLAQRKYLYQNFNMQLFDLYDRRMGKGEDGILSYTVSKTRPLHYCGEQIFWHNDQGNSVYTQDHYRFNKIVAFSRAYLNFEYHRLNNFNMSTTRWNYFNYSFWRFIGLIINLILKPSRTSWESVKGSLSGWRMGLMLKFDDSLSRNVIWHERALIDIDNSTK